ncbi:hypothetical protein BDN71DRAFT_1542552 [Pleurotus eryngii]|uniref:Uncharacterized protein n=1 Tax=Pleurotus eryngii TaxID=5323 RepID=A0A9P5ZH01_PLEER|nr:hypothetical protein BDN71DRAFT_1542552 [Pleurotus eryngii]
MLSMALKIVWFVLTFTGMISCWAVLGAFASTMQTYWWALAYCFGITCLEGIFWLGIVWQMDPAQMPRSFCLAQTFIAALASFVLAGAVAASTLATVLFVSRPKTWADGDLYLLVWRKQYAGPLLLFPAVALGTLVGVTLRLDAVHPSSDSMSCEATNPVWVRFLGYAGPPLLLCVPTFGATLYCIVRVHRTHQHIARARTRYPDGGALPHRDAFMAPRARTRTRKRGLHRDRGDDYGGGGGGGEHWNENGNGNGSGNEHDVERMSSSNTLTAVPARAARRSSRISLPRDTTVVSSDSADSDTFPTFAPPSNTPSIAEVNNNNYNNMGINRVGNGMGDITSMGDGAGNAEGAEKEKEKDAWRFADLDAAHMDTEGDGDGAMEMIQWRKGSIEQVSTMNIHRGMGGMGGMGEDDDDDDDRSSWDKNQNPRVRRSTALSTLSRRPSLCTLPPTTWRVIHFQIHDTTLTPLPLPSPRQCRTFTLLQFLSSLSTLVYAARGHAPPFAVHHVCMVLVAWAPVLFFGAFALRLLSIRILFFVLPNIRILFLPSPVFLSSESVFPLRWDWSACTRISGHCYRHRAVFMCIFARMLKLMRERCRICVCRNAARGPAPAVLLVAAPAPPPATALAASTPNPPATMSIHFLIYSTFNIPRMRACHPIFN